LIRRPPSSTLFPYTRSSDLGVVGPVSPLVRAGIVEEVDVAPALQVLIAPAVLPPLLAELLRGGVALTRVVGQDRIEGGGIEADRSEEHTSELQSLRHLVCRL